MSVAYPLGSNLAMKSATIVTPLHTMRNVWRMHSYTSYDQLSMSLNMSHTQYKLETYHNLR